MRFSRDKRGYEHTCVVHRHGHGEPRVLYWFRTPPFVKVGRSAFDPETIQLLEARHPEITFDWNRMLKEPPQAPPPELDRRREAREAREERQARRRRAEERAQDAPHLPAGGELPDLEEDLDATVPAGLADVFEVGEGGPLEESAIEEAEAVSAVDTSDQSGADADGAHPLLELLGSEGLMRLRARHAALLARIAEVPDEARREALKADAALVDPDGWLTAEEARAGLETYEARYEALRTALGVRRTRRRRRGRRPAEP